MIINEHGSYTTQHSYLEKAPSDIQKLIFAGFAESSIEETEVLYKKALDIAITKYGKFSKETAMCQDYYSGTLGKQDKTLEALEIQIGLQQSEGKIYGPHDPERVGTINNMALEFQRINEHKNAELCFLWAIELTKLNTDHDSSELYNYGCFLQRRYDDENARTAFLNYIKNTKTINYEDPTYANALHRIASTYKRQNDFEPSEKYYLLSITSHLKHKFTHEISNTYHNLAMLYIKIESWEKAETFFKKSIKINHDSKDWLSALESYRQLARTFFKSNNSNSALDTLKEAKLLAKEQLFKDNELEYIEHINSVCDLLLSNDFFDKGQLELIELSELIKSNENKTQYTNTIFTIANQYKEHNDWAKAILHYEKGIPLVALVTDDDFIFNIPNSKINYCFCLIKENHLQKFREFHENEFSEEEIYGYDTELKYLNLLALLKGKEFDQLTEELTLDIQNKIIEQNKVEDGYDY